MSNYTPISTKYCKKCQRELPATLDFFWKDNHLKGGLMNSCIECNRKREIFPDGFKQCPKCKELLPSTKEYFISSRHETNGLGSYCKKCFRAIEAIRRAEKRSPTVEIPIGYRVCGVCLSLFPSTREFFSTNKNGKNGLQSFCKSCGKKLQRKYRTEYPDRIKNMEKKRQNSTKRRLQSKIYSRKRYHSDPHKKAHNRIKNQIRRARKKGASGFYTRQDIETQYKSQKGLCWWCGIPLNGKYDIDHVIPLSRGGSNWPNNLVCSCEFCNSSKHNKLPYEWCGRLF